MWLTHFWHSWSQFFIFAWDVTAGGILRTGVLICLVSITAILRFWIPKFVFSEFRSFVPSFFSLWKKGGGGGIFSVQDYVIYTLYEFSGISLFVCYVAPYLNQVFRRCFSMDNLRAYAEDDSASSPSTGQLAKRPPPSSEGLSTSSSSRTSSMAVPTTHVTSGPDPAVSAPTTSNPTVIQDKTVALEDIPPPPPAEPYEQFLARVSRELATLPGGPPQPADAAPPQPAVPIPTTGSRLPMPFPRYSRGMNTLLGLLNNKLKWSGSGCPYQRPVMPRHLLLGRGPAVPAPPVRGPAPLRSTPGPTSLLGPAALPIRPITAGPTPVLPPPSSSQNLKSTSPPPRAFADFFRVPCPLLSRWRWRPVRTLRLLRSCPKTLGTFSKVLHRRWFEAGKLSGSRIWNSTGNNYKVTLHLSQLRVPLYPKGTWAPTHCGSWVPLTTERRHGLSISPVQIELAVILADTVAPTRGPLLIATGPGTADLRRHRTPPPRRDTGHPLPNALAETDTRGPMTVAHLKAGSVLNALADLGPLALQVTGVVITLTLLHLSAGIGVARLPLVGPTGPARLRGLLGALLRRLHGGHHLIDDGLDIPHRTVTYRLRPVLEGLIIVYHPLLLGRLHPKGPEPRVSLSPVTSPGLSAGNVTHIPIVVVVILFPTEYKQWRTE